MDYPSFTQYRRWFAFDVETSSVNEDRAHALQPWSERGELRSFSISHFSDQADRWGTLDGITASGYNDLHPQLNSGTKRSSMDQVLANFLHVTSRQVHHAPHAKPAIVCWNAPFDVAWLIARGFREQVFKIQWIDAMLLWKHLTRIPESELTAAKRKSYSLKAAVAEFYPQHAGYGEGIDFSDASFEGMQKLLHYNRMDAEFTLGLGEFFWDQLRHHPKQMRNALIEASCIPMVADSYINGICVDLRAADHLNNQLDEEIKVKKSELALYGVTPQVVASPSQLSKLFFEEWKLPVISRTPKGAPSTDKEALHELSLLDSRITDIQRLRELVNLRTKFVANIVDSCKYNRKAVTHPTANIYSTYTGRMTFGSTIGKGKGKVQTGFAIHQMKRADEFRRLITVPEGYMLVEWDAAGQEYRWMAIESGDETMLRLCQPGEDPHSYMGASIMPAWKYRVLQAEASRNPEAKEVRQLGKVGNLSCQYRIGPKSLLRTARVNYGMDIKLPEAELIHSTYHKTYPGIKRYWKRKVREAQNAGYAETKAGRRVLLSGNWSGDTAWQLESTAVNFPVQGIGADQKYLAMRCINPLLTKYGGKFYFELHDGLYAIFPKAVAKKAAREGEHILSNLPYKKAWGFTPPIPLPWDTKIGANWGDSKPL